MSRLQSVDDFLKWYEATNTHTPPVAIGEGLPQGVTPLASRYGTFGSKATLAGGPLPAESPRTVPCMDAEAQPPAPCSFNGGCTELLELAHKFKTSIDQAKVAADQAENALRWSSILQRRVKAAVERARNSAGVSSVLPDGVEDEDGRDDMVAGLFGPMTEEQMAMGQNDYVLPRLIKAWDSDKMAATYMDRATLEGPLVLPLSNPGRRGTLGMGAVDSTTPCCDVECGDCSPERPLKLADPINIHYNAEGDFLPSKSCKGENTMSCILRGMAKKPRMPGGFLELH